MTSNTEAQDKGNSSLAGTFLEKIRAGLAKTRGRFSEGVQAALLGKKTYDDDLLEALETLLLSADVGVDATAEILDALKARASRRELKDPEAVHAALQDELTAMLEKVQAPLVIDDARKPFVILMVGVNGVGKTTTIGKLAGQFQAEGKSVMLAAGDTFRAAAVEQLKAWGERNQVPVIAQGTGADSASVCFDALSSAKARGADILIADTAGRLQNKKNLMDELGKITRVMSRQDETAPHEVLLVLDAGTGQNAISQAREFLNTVPVSGLVVSKLDGSAKGGVIFAIAKQLALPIRYIGVGEGVDDLRPFSAAEFVAALFE